MDNSHDKCFFKIERETSKYNKYMKWHLIYYREDMSVLASHFTKTEREAMENVKQSKEIGERGFPIGNRITYTTYDEIV